MSDLSLALLEELTKAVRDAPKPSFDPFTGDMEDASVDDFAAALAPILSRALAEAAQEGAEKMRDGILNQIRSIPCWNNGQTSEFDIEDQSHRLTVLDDIKWVPNPYLTEKEKSNDGH